VTPERQRPAADEESQEQAAAPQSSAKRRKRDRSARARKDRLRSTAANTGAEQTDAPGPSSTKSGWLVPPEKAAAFEPAVPVGAAPQPPPPLHKYPIYVPPSDAAAGASWVAPPVSQPAPPVAHAAPAPTSTISLAPPLTESPQFRGGATIATQPASAPIRLKQDTGKFRQGTIAPIADSHRASDFGSAPDMFAPGSGDGRGNPFPWKLVAAAAAVLAVIITGVSLYTPSPKPAARTTPPTTAPAPAPTQEAETPPTTGTIAVVTQPPGIRVLLDGKPAGESPVTLQEVSPGRHTVTLLATGGTVKRTVRVEPGKTASLDLPIFSGFAAFSAPIVVDVAENGRSLGTSENPIMLSAGRHDLTISNRDLQYSAKESVDIEPGETKRVELDPRGTVNINAQPWAEVWIDGHKVGETPLANLSIPLGVREIVFKHPQFGERRVTTTVVSGTPAAVSVDFSKQ
jgi:hypothetical protein